MFEITSLHIARHLREFYQISLMANVYTKARIQSPETFTSTDRQAELEP